MICNRTEHGWEILYQRAHALLAAQLVLPWRPEERPALWMPTLSAIAQHDNGWQEWEPGRRLTDLGIPRDFTETPAADLVAQSERALTRAWHQGLWCGLLVSRHLTRLYEPLRGTDPDLDRLLDAQGPLRARWRASLGAEPAAVEAAYALLNWGDTLSLTLCRRRLPPDARALEIGAGPDGTRYDVFARDDGTLGITPWPYACAAFDVTADTYRLDQLTFENDEALARALRAAPVTVRRWTLRTDDA